MREITLKLGDLSGFEQKTLLADIDDKRLFSIVKHHPTETKTEYKLIYYTEDKFSDNMKKNTVVFSTLRSAVYGFNNTDNLKEND